VLALAVVGAAGAGAAAIAGARSGASCGPGIPAFKCDPGGPVAGPSNRPTAVAAPAPYRPSAETVACGPGFFPSAVVARLSARFGSLSCFRFADDEQWVVFADGMQTDGDGPAPGGAIVAVSSCAGAGRSSCLDPAAQHDFASFTVARPPDPAAWPMRLQTSFAGRLLYVADGACGVLTLDLRTLRWLGKSTSTIESVLAGGIPPAVAAPAPVTGAKALAAPVPTPSAGCAS
jgi:hypothetical protein